MIIENIRTKQIKSKLYLMADVRWDSGQKQQAYFAVDIKDKAYIVTDASPFLAAFLLPCMRLGENMVVKGTVSEKVLHNTKEIMKLFTKQWQMDFHTISVHVKKTNKDTYHAKQTACFFSAGVDSFYTYLKYKKHEKQSIDTFLFVHGFDIELKNTALFQTSLKHVQAVAKEEKIRVISVETNIKQLIEPILLWDWGHGGALGAVSLLLRKKLQTVFISGSVRFDQLFPYGTHPQLDKLWSSETLQVVHDGDEHDRLGKITDLVGSSPLALKYLRVCAQNRRGVYNCSQCFKCLMTMIYLASIDTLKDTKTFKHTIDLEKVKHMYYDYKLNYQVQALSVLKVLKKKNLYPDLQEAMEESLERSKHPSFVRRMANDIALFDQKYNKRRLYQFVFKMNDKQDRSMFFKFLANTGIIK